MEPSQKNQPVKKTNKIQPTLDLPTDEEEKKLLGDIDAKTLSDVDSGKFEHVLDKKLEQASSSESAQAAAEHNFYNDAEKLSKRRIRAIDTAYYFGIILTALGIFSAFFTYAFPTIGIIVPLGLILTLFTLGMGGISGEKIFNLISSKKSKTTT